MGREKKTLSAGKAYRQLREGGYQDAYLALKRTAEIQEKISTARGEGLNFLQEWLDRFKFLWTDPLYLDQFLKRLELTNIFTVGNDSLCRLGSDSRNLGKHFSISLVDINLLDCRTLLPGFPWSW